MTDRRAPARLHLVVWTPGETILDVTDVQWVHVQLVGRNQRVGRKQGKRACPEHSEWVRTGSRAVARDSTPLTIWPGHAPLLGKTVAEPIQYADTSGTHLVDLPSGIVHVKDDRITIFLAGAIGDQVSGQGDGEQGALNGMERLAEALLAALGLAASSSEQA